MHRSFALTLMLLLAGLVLSSAGLAQVMDTMPPMVCCQTEVTTLWQPNHNLVDVGFCFWVGDNLDPNPSVGIAVYANEADEEDTGDGTFAPDAVLTCCGKLFLRAERQGNGCGRVYLVLVAATDASGNVSVCSTTVVVPKSKSAAAIAKVNAIAAYAKEHFDTKHFPPAGFVLIGRIETTVGPKGL